jgi:entericidin A
MGIRSPAASGTPGGRIPHLDLLLPGREKRSAGTPSEEMVMNKMRLIALVLVASMAASFVAACNTVKGVGRDIESVGDAGEDAIDKRR